MHLGLVELAQELLALGELLLQGGRVLRDGLLRVLGRRRRVEQRLLVVLDLLLEVDDLVGERFRGGVEARRLVGVARLRLLIGLAWSGSAGDWVGGNVARPVGAGFAGGGAAGCAVKAITVEK